MRPPSFDSQSSSAFIPLLACTGMPAEHAERIRAGFGGHVQGFHELRVAHTGAQVDKRLLGDLGGLPEMY
jgi:hypothetical protein